MQKVTLWSASLLAMAALAGCGGGSSNSSSTTSSSGSTSTTAETATVNLVVQDTPATNLTVLSFQIQITGAVLQPGNVSLLPKPVTVDLAQLVSDTGFLSSAVIGSATYTSLTLTFANPQVTIVNNSGTSIVTPAQTCASGAVCTFNARLNSASLTISSGVFPITLTASSSTGLALDLSIPDLLQSDLSVTLADGSSVNLSVLPQPRTGTVQAQVDDVLAVVQSVSSGQVKIKTAAGELLVLTTDSNTTYNYPQSVCPTSGAACVVASQAITADVSLLANGGLQARSITFAAAPGATVAQGVVVAVGSGSSATFEMLVRRVLPDSAGLTPGQLVDVTADSAATYSIASTSYPPVTGGTFSSSSDLLPGQEVLVGVIQPAALQADGHPGFTSDQVTLESSQIAGKVASVDNGSQTFLLTNTWSLFKALSAAIPQLEVQTGTGSSFVNLTPADLTAVSAGSAARVKGPLFNTTSGSNMPTMGALQVNGRL
jgi:hypothetical protein